MNKKIGDRIKDFLAKRKIQKYINSSSRKPVFTNIEQAKNIGILFAPRDASDNGIIKNFIKQNSTPLKRIIALGFADDKFMDPDFKSSLNLKYFSLQNLNRIGLPKIIEVKNFTDDTFDLLLVLHFNDKNVMHYISTLSNAKFKVGYSRKNENLDFRVITKNKNLNELIQECSSYLNQIK